MVFGEALKVNARKAWSMVHGAWRFRREKRERRERGNQLAAFSEPQNLRATEVGDQRADDRRQRTALRQAQGLAAGG